MHNVDLETHYDYRSHVATQLRAIIFN